MSPIEAKVAVDILQIINCQDLYCTAKSSTRTDHRLAGELMSKRETDLKQTEQNWFFAVVRKVGKSRDGKCSCLFVDSPPPSR